MRWVSRKSAGCGIGLFSFMPLAVLRGLCLVVVQRRIWQQGKHTRPLDCACQLALMLGAVAGYAGWNNLGTLGDKHTQHIRVLVIDLQARISTEFAEFPASLKTSARRRPTICTALGPALAAVT
jgi:hypothetical protein